VPEPAVAPMAAPVATTAGDLRGLRVLCVDNDPAILEGMRQLLGRWGLQVWVAGDLPGAVAVISGEDVEVVLADYHLGAGADGLALLAALRPLAARPFHGVLITADHGSALELAARAAGYPLLRKPLRPASLRALLASLHGGLQGPPQA